MNADVDNESKVAGCVEGMSVHTHTLKTKDKDAIIQHVPLPRNCW